MSLMLGTCLSLTLSMAGTPRGTHTSVLTLLPRKQAQRGAPAHEIQVSVGFRVSLALPPV